MISQSKHKIRNIWLASFDLLKTNSSILLPFIFIAFFEMMAIELVYFSSRRPLLVIAGPIVRKFFGETFLHYPANLVLLSRLFYYVQIVIYIFAGVLLAGMCVNIFKNVREGLPVRANAIVKNALKRYWAFLGFGIIMIILIILIKKVDLFVFSKSLRLASGHLPKAILKLYPIWLSLFLFISNVIIQVFTVLTIPIIVIRKKSLIKALAGSVSLGFLNFAQILKLLFPLFFIYLPITLLKGASTEMINKIFPESVLLINIIGIVMSMFVDCFIIICASQWILEKEARL